MKQLAKFLPRFLDYFGGGLGMALPFLLNNQNKIYRPQFAQNAACFIDHDMHAVYMQDSQGQWWLMRPTNFEMIQEKQD